MGCSEGDINNNCLTRQSFCALGKQKVSQNDIRKTIESIPEFTEANMWKQIKTILNNIQSYGKRGTRNPSDSSINNIPFPNKEDFDELILYNNIIKSLRTGTNNININNGELLDKEEFLNKIQVKNLQTYINNYKLNIDRCNSCNTQCNATCQASKQSGSGSDCGAAQYGCSSSSQGGPCLESSGDCMSCLVWQPAGACISGETSG